MGAVRLWIKASYSRHVHCVLNKNYSWMHVRVGQFTSQWNHLITPLSVLFHWVFFSCLLLLFFWGGAHGYLVKHDPRLFLASPVWLFDFNTWQDWHYLIYSPHKCVLLCTLRHTEGGSSPTQDTLPQEVDDVCYCPMLNGWQVVRNRAGSDRVYEEQENRKKKKTSKIRK